jgi:HlyD family secretion protein
VGENHGGGNSLKSSSNLATRVARLAVLVSLVLAAGFVSSAMAGQSAPEAGTPRAVSALGRLEPQGGIVEISASSVPDALQGGVLAQLFVEVGDDVEIGQLLAVTDTADVLRAKVDEARTRLALVQQQAAASRSSADATCVRSGVLQREADRLGKLREQDLAAEEETDRAIGEAEAAAADCTAARSAVLVAEADISVARARLARQEKEMARSQIVSPSAGKVLAINARPGERIDTGGILELGNVARMYAIAEVYETDVSRLRLGQQATVSSAALPGDLDGRIERIRPIVRKQDQIGTDPAARKDARIIEVEVLLDSADAAASFTNLQVDVVFQP